VSKITEGKKRFVKRALRNENPTILIGKSGVSSESVKEIERQLEKNKMVKVRVLRTALLNEDTKQIARRLSEQTGSNLVEVRGHTFMLYKARNA